MLGREHLFEKAGAPLQLVGERLKVAVELFLARNQTKRQRAPPFTGLVPRRGKTHEL
jgi:hypothetical protein